LLRLVTMPRSARVFERFLIDLGFWGQPDRPTGLGACVGSPSYGAAAQLSYACSRLDFLNVPMKHFCL
jgi:hypothetical protein